MTFLPGGGLLITEKPGNLVIYRMVDRSRVSVKGVPEVAYDGQGGLGGVILHPCYSENHWIYFSYSEQNLASKRWLLLRVPDLAQQNLSQSWKMLK